MSLVRVLAPSERRAPWCLYTLPGLLPALLVRKAGTTLLMLAFQQVLFPRVAAAQDDGTPGGEGPNEHTFSFSAAHLAIYLVWNTLALAITLPLDCAITRLATQRDYEEDRADYGVAHAYTDAPEGRPAPVDAPRAERGDARAPLVSLRTGRRPYTGLRDCFATMAAEEGPASLTRGAGLAFLALLLVNVGAPAR